MATMKMPCAVGTGESNGYIGMLDSTYNGSSGSVETLTCPLSCSSFEIIATDIRSSTLQGGLKVNGSTISSSNYTTVWQSMGSYGGRVSVNYALSTGDTITYESTAGSSGSHSAIVMFVE